MKDLFIAAYEQLISELMDRGYSEEDAERIASERAYKLAWGQLADLADTMRARAKEER